MHVRTLSAGAAAGRRLGFCAESVDPRIEAIAGRGWTARNALEVLKMTLDVLCRRAVLEVDDLRDAIERVQPDARWLLQLPNVTSESPHPHPLALGRSTGFRY